MKLTIGKMTCEGEQINAEIEVDLAGWHPEKHTQVIKDAITPVLSAMDDRLLEMNLRIVRHNTMAREFGKKSPEGFLVLQNVIDVLHGRRPATPEIAAAVFEQGSSDNESVAEKTEDAKKGADIIQFGERRPKK